MGYLETLKNITKDKKRKRENLILLLVLLVIMLVSINYIFKDNTKATSTIDKNDNISKSKEANDIKDENVEDIESKIENILNQIKGVTDVSVIINYSDNGRYEYAYDEKTSVDNEKNVSNTEKIIAYNDVDGDKKAITSIKYLPNVEGVIIVGSGLENSDLRQKISSAVGNLLGIPSYEVQVFSK